MHAFQERGPRFRNKSIRLITKIELHRLQCPFLDRSGSRESLLVGAEDAGLDVAIGRAALAKRRPRLRLLLEALPQRRRSLREAARNFGALRDFKPRVDLQIGK